jgi:hypothetical protein
LPLLVHQGHKRNRSITDVSGHFCEAVNCLLGFGIENAVAVKSREAIGLIPRGTAESKIVFFIVVLIVKEATSVTHVTGEAL